MLKKIMIGLLLVSSLFSQTDWKNKFFGTPKSIMSFRFADKFLKYSTAYASFSLNAPRYQDDRFAIIGGLSTGTLEISRDKEN